MRKIVTRETNPNPYLPKEWCAYYEDEEEAGNYGYGTTEEAAIKDFIENCAPFHDERLGKWEEKA